MLIENQGDSFETLVSQNQNLNFEYLNSIFNKQNVILDDNKYKSLNITNLNNQYTNLGLLLSDECPYSIKCAIYNCSLDVLLHLIMTLLEHIQDNLLYQFFLIQ